LNLQNSSNVRSHRVSTPRGSLGSLRSTPRSLHARQLALARVLEAEPEPLLPVFSILPLPLVLSLSLARHGRRELEFGRRRSPTSERFAAQQPPPLPSPCLATSRAHARPSYWPPEQRRRLAARLHATGVCGQGATAHLWTSRGHTRVRTTPLAIPRHSTADDEQPPAATASSDDLPVQNPVKDLLQKFDESQGSNCEVSDSDE